ncbi:MAG: cell wall hydrolase, partial [Qipengyuania flava]
MTTPASAARHGTGARRTLSPYARRKAERRNRRRQMAGRGALLAGAIALPTVAAQGEWGDFRTALGIEEERVALTAMPFETPGQSFPGSAFYYLEDAPR